MAVTRDRTKIPLNESDVMCACIRCALHCTVCTFNGTTHNHFNMQSKFLCSITSSFLVCRHQIMHRTTASIRKVVFLLFVIELQANVQNIFNADYDIVTGAKKSEETPGV